MVGPYSVRVLGVFWDYHYGKVLVLVDYGVPVPQLYLINNNKLSGRHSTSDEGQSG